MSKIIINCVVIAFFLLSCERKIQENGKIKIQFPKPTEIQKSISDITTFASGAAPTAWSDIDCYGFLISGPETSLRQNKCEIYNGQNGVLSTDSLYFGSAHAGFYKNESAELEIASGSDRVITAIGFKTNMPSGTEAAATACKNLLKEENNLFSKAFIIAKSAPFKVEPGSVQSVTMPINYIMDSTSFLGDCAGPTAPGSGYSGSKPVAGPPVKIKMRLQDNLTNVIRGSCVFVAFDLLDANDQMATVSENFDFAINEVSSTKAKFSLASDNCDGGGLSYSQNFSFYSGGNKFNRFVMAMEPHIVSAGINFTLTQSTGTALAQDLIQNLEIISDSNPSPDYPFTVNVFDKQNFRSSKSSSPSTPIEVRAGDCIPAIVQVLDSFGRPLAMINNYSAGGAGDELVSTVTSASFDTGYVEFSANTSCSAPISSHQVAYLYNIIYMTGLNQFFMKVPTGFNKKTFNITVSLSGNGFYDISHPITGLNPTAAINNKSFWKIKE